MLLSVLEAQDIEQRHCHMDFTGEKVSLIVDDGMCSINSVKVDSEQVLSHGELNSKT